MQYILDHQYYYCQLSMKYPTAVLTFTCPYLKIDNVHTLAGLLAFVIKMSKYSGF